MKNLILLFITLLFVSISFSQTKVDGLVGMTLNYNKTHLLVLQEIEGSVMLIQRDTKTLKPIKYYSFTSDYIIKDIEYLKIPSAVDNRGKYYAFTPFINNKIKIQDSIVIYDLESRTKYDIIDITHLKLRGGQACKFNFNVAGDKMYYGTAMEIYEYDLIKKESTKIHNTKGYSTYDSIVDEPITCDYRKLRTGDIVIENLRTLGGMKYVSDIEFGGIWDKNNGNGYITWVGDSKLIYKVRSLEIYHPFEKM